MKQIFKNIGIFLFRGLATILIISVVLILIPEIFSFIFGYKSGYSFWVQAHSSEGVIGDIIRSAHGKYNCHNFKSKKEVQFFFDRMVTAGHSLDSDDDSDACEDFFVNENNF